MSDRDRRDRRDGREVDDEDEKTTMADVSHTHPHTSETFGAVFQRGPAMADGGERSERARRGTMRDVDHTPRHGEDVSEVWARGGNERQAVRDDRESTGASVDE